MPGAEHAPGHPSASWTGKGSRTLGDHRSQVELCTTGQSTLDGLNLRVIERDGEPWFGAKEVCEVLDLKPDAGNGSLQNHMRRLDSDEWKTESLPNVNGTSRKQYVINESGLYSLILRSRKPEARAFKKWITSEVLPAIRKNGGYMTPEVAKQAVEDPAVFMARALVIANETPRSGRFCKPERALLDTESFH